MTSKIVRLLAGVAIGILLLGIVGARTRAQGSITISFASFGSAAWPAGPDYATDVLGDPWDFCNRDDVAPDPLEIVGWSNFTINTNNPCTVGGTTVRLSNGSIDTQLSLLYRGRYGIVNPGRTGRTVPIDPAKYTRLAYRQSDSAGTDGGRISWFHYPWEDPASPDANGGGMRFAASNVQGYKIYSYDMTQPQPGTPVVGLPWNNGLPVRGLRVAPNSTTEGHTVLFDWVRLTYPDNATGSAMQTVSWSGGSGTATVDVLDSNGTVLNLGSTSAGSLSFNYGVLPPGSYTVRVTRGSASGTRTFTINTPPLIQLTDPNETGSEDYATTVLGNAWDMNSVTDVQISGADNYTPVPPNFSGGILTATNTSGDPNITLLNQSNNGVTIDSSRYRFLTYRMSIDDPNRTREFGIVRVMWTSQQYLDGLTATSTEDIEVWPGFNPSTTSDFYTYTVDLAALTTAADGGLETAGSPERWTAARKTGFRFDPSEFPDPRAFHIDYVKLAAMHEAIGGGFLFKWTMAMGSPTSSVVLYIDNDTNATNGKTLIASGLTASQGQYFWNAGGTTPGDYWIYAEANDGIQTYGRYSTGQLRVFGAGGSTPNPAMALDSPSNGASVSVGSSLTTSGWAIDRGAGSGTGVDQVHVWAFTSNGSAATMVGVATYGSARPDIGNLFGSQFTNSGFSISTSSLPVGTYQIVAYSHSSVSNSFSANRSATVSVVGGSAPNPAMVIDTPASGSQPTMPFTISGWAIDRGSSSGPGVSQVHIWAFPVGGGSAVFVGQATYGIARGDIGAAFGSRFTNSGYSLSVNNLTRNVQYDVVVYAFSTVSNSFNQWAGTRVIPR